jgi:hypothetical protein
LCRLEDFSVLLQRQVNHPVPLPPPWALMIRPTVLMEYLLPKGGGATAGRRRGEGGGGAVADFSDVGAVGCAEGGDVAASGDAGAAAVCPVLEGEVDGGGMVCVEDLEVGGKYRIPKKKRGWSTY